MSAIPITVTGTIATEPTARTLPSGRACASFRLAVNHWRVDKSTGEFVTDGTSWFGIDCYGELASNAAMSLNTGAAVIVTGNLRNREWTTDERSGISPTVVAEHIGPDLRYGTAHYRRAKAADRPQSHTGQTETASSGSAGGAWSGLGPVETPAPESDGNGLSTSSERLSPAGMEGFTEADADDEPAGGFRRSSGSEPTADSEVSTDSESTVDSAAGDGVADSAGGEEDAIAAETAKAAAPF